MPPSLASIVSMRSGRETSLLDSADPAPILLGRVRTPDDHPAKSSGQNSSSSSGGGTSPTTASPTSSTGSVTELRPSPLRKGSLSHLWSTLITEIREAMLGDIPRVEAAVLDASQDEWIPVTATFPAGRLLLERAGRGPAGSQPTGPFASIPLAGATVLGHLTKSTLQVVAGSQTVLLYFYDHRSFVEGSAALLAWSRTRGEGLANKVWIPPLRKLEDQRGNLLLCRLEAHFTASSNEAENWRKGVGKLSRSGVLSVIKDKETIFELDLTTVSCGSVRRVDSSLVNNRRVVFIVPDMGGPESVYLKFFSDDDFDDWFVSLRNFTRQTIYAPLSKNAKECVRMARCLKISTVGARLDSGPEDFSFRNTFLDFCFDDWIWARTFVHTVSEAPLWAQEFVFQDLDGNESPLEVNFRYADPIDGPNELSPSLGRVTIPQTSCEGIHWFRLTPNPETSDISVSVQLNLVFDQTPVLDAAYYRELRVQVNNLDSELAYKLGETNTAELKPLCELFFNIHMSESRQAEWVVSLIDAELRRMSLTNVVEHNTLFRGNSMMTRGFERFLQVLGRTTLERTVKRVVRKVMASNDSFELDPSRLKVPQHELSRVLRLNRVTVTNYLTYLWSLILSEGVPDSFRYVFTHLAQAMRSQMNADDDRVWMSVAAFLFLRFFCPALLNPSIFGLTEGSLKPADQRALTILAKLLQGFANRVRFGSKEPWLVPMNAFMAEHEPELIQWNVHLTTFEEMKRPLERAPKQLPMVLFMRNELSNPYLIDTWASYSKLVAWSADVRFDPLWDACLRRFFLECKQLVNEQHRLLAKLERNDTLEPVGEILRDLDVKVNWDSMLFGTSSAAIEPGDRSLPKKRSTWRILDKLK